MYLKLIIMDIVFEHAEYNNQVAAYNIAMKTALIRAECLFHEKKVSSELLVYY